MTKRDIGSVVQALGRKLGMTTTEPARRVGISQAQISRLENGLQGFRPSTGSGRPERVEGRSRTVVRIAKAPGKPPFCFLVNHGPWKACERGRQ